jgi:hypothetical protein
LYFDPQPEPDNFYYDLIKDLDEKFKGSNIKYIKCEFDNAEDFYKALSDMEKINDKITINATSREGKYDMIINEEGDMDDLTKPQTIALAKKKLKKTKIE